MKVQKSKGMRDLFPSDMQKFRLISECFREACIHWGYEEVRTPTLENLHLFTAAGTLTPGMLGKVYSFLDWDGWSGERVVLRPDATIPVARMYIESMPEKELAKLFYIVNTFIFDETGKKNRERWQLGAEMIGIGSPLADVELMAMAVEVLKKIGLPQVEIRLSHAGLTRGILKKLGLSAEDQVQIFNRLLDGDSSVLSQIKTERPELVPLLEIQGQSSGFVKNLAAVLNMSDLKPQIDDFVFIADALKSLGLAYRIDIASVRGFEYYTGVMFQLFAEDEKVGGGGRYDALIPAMGGPNTQASGLGLYLDRLMQLVKTEVLEARPLKKVLLKMDPTATQAGFALAESLRRSGYIVKLHLGGKGPGDIQWKVEVGGQPLRFVLSEMGGGRSYDLYSPAEVLAKLAGG
ncbi:MAG TPA: HisS family protein [Dehalococcoidales bacterium]|nr:HisS family protein [Dehalococcoidales bacterium]